MPTFKLQDRLHFERSCRKYRKHALKELEHRSNGIISDARNSSSTPNISSNTLPHSSSNVITRSYSVPESAFQNSSDDGPTPSDPAIRPSAQSSPSAPHLIPELPFTQRLSRSMRVFVAWKAIS